MDQHTNHHTTGFTDLPTPDTITLEIYAGGIVGIYPICDADLGIEIAIRRLASIIRPGVIIHHEEAMRNLSVFEIVRNYLGAGGFEGLFNENLSCCCLITKLAPCGDINSGCRAGYNQGPGNGRGWSIGPALMLRCPACGVVCERKAGACPSCGAKLD